jgi:hypothetical protein
MSVQIGDIVKVWKWIYDTAYEAKGKVEDVRIDDKTGTESVKVNGDWFEVANDETHKCRILRAAEGHKHAPQIRYGQKYYVCLCGARQRKSKIVDGKKVEVWEFETEAERRARERAIEMLETEGYGYDYNQPEAQDQYDGGRGAGQLGQPVD